MAEAAVAPPADAAARARIVDDLGATLFVGAGAGTGKTTELVNRVHALVAAGVPLESIAAVTFTEKAAAELRDRIRHRLEEGAYDPSRVVADRCRTALDQLDGAALGTLHAFASRLLSQHPVEAGIPPLVEVLDEVSSGVEFERRWTAFRDDLLADPTQERTLVLLLACGVPHRALRALAVAFDDNWDLVEERVAPSAPEPPDAFAALEDALAPVDAVCAETVRCADADDKLAARLADIAEYAARLRASAGEVQLLEALADDALPRPPSFRVGNAGQQPKWHGVDLKDLRRRVREAGDGLATVHHTVACACAERLAGAIRGFTLAAAEERRAAGRLEFHDLLVLSRALLRDARHGPAVRASLHRRYRRLLLDEFQDTDPIQIDLAVRIAAADPAGEAAGWQRWDEVDVAPGRLFVVGDPKQSIYRFRRADIATFLTAQQRFSGEEGSVELTANFRTGRPVVEWVNAVFAAMLGERPDDELPVPSQPPYVALSAVRPGPPAGPPVSVLGRNAHPHDAAADAVRAAEAAEVVDTVTRAVTERWSVGDVTAPGGWRPARLGDVAILVPARTSLPFLEEALEGAGIAYRADSSSLVYATRAVRDLLMVLRAVDDPTDHLRIVSALRTPLLACGDDDLFRFKVERGGHWSYLVPVPDTVPADDPVAVGLAYLRGLHDARHWAAPSVLLDRIARDRRALELGFAEGRPRDVWRRLRFVIDQARAWSESTGGSLRRYLQWVELQTAEGARVAEAVLPETDDDAVRILTVHAAKGLEFPVTVVSGLSTAPQARAAPAEVVFPPGGGVGYRFGRRVATPEFVAWQPLDEQMGHDERKRLLYVACTRARDHLVVSLHRRARASEPAPARRTNAELLVAALGAGVDDLPDGPSPDAGRPSLDPPSTPSPPPPLDEWAEQRAAALRRASVPLTVAATALGGDGAPDPGGDPDPGLGKRPRDLDLPPWLKGRYGTAVGRAVHGVLQAVDLATGAGLDAAVAAQCEAEAVPDRADDVRRLAAAALRSPTVREAAGGPHWREVYACTPLDGGRLLEGYVDLLYRGPDGLVVVDHKTSASSDADELDARVEGYRHQGASYALAVEQATGETVARVTFVFLTPDGAVERHLDRLCESMERVRELVAAGAEVTVD